MKGNCTKLERYNGQNFEVIGNRVSITGPARMRETVDQELTLDCGAAGGSETKKKSPGTKEIGDISVEVIANFTSQTGVRQVITATAAGTVSAPGEALVTLTSGFSGATSKVFNIPVSAGPPEDWAKQIRAYLAADSLIAGLFEVSGSGAAIVLSVRANSAGESLPNDATLKLALATGTATGITAAPSSANTASAVVGWINPERHDLFDRDFDRETATFWRVRHSNAAETGIIVHGTIKEIGEPSYQPNQTVKLTVVIEPTGEFFLKSNAITSAILPLTILAPSDNWGA